jgi:carbon-monoxide dehydrogenase medium subunit
MLKQFGEDAKLLSGGHSLLPMMKLSLAQPAHLIDITKASDLRQISEHGGKVIIGAAATHDQVAGNDTVRGAR